MDLVVGAAPADGSFAHDVDEGQRHVDADRRQVDQALVNRARVISCLEGACYCVTKQYQDLADCAVYVAIVAPALVALVHCAFAWSL